MNAGTRTFAGMTVLAAGIVYYVHFTEQETKQRMRQGPKRDRAMIEKKTAELFKERLADWSSDEDSESQAKLSSTTPVPDASNAQ